MGLKTERIKGLPVSADYFHVLGMSRCWAAIFFLKKIGALVLVSPSWLWDLEAADRRRSENCRANDHFGWRTLQCDWCDATGVGSHG
jgi:hypothetical protein